MIGDLERAAPASAPPRPTARRAIVLEAAALAIMLVVAVWLRADRLMQTPVFTDESMEVMLALDTLAAGRLNLVGVSSFLGGLHTWLLMAVIALPGVWVEGPRLLSLVAGVLTVLLTVLLGRELGGRWAGLLAGGLLATSLAHVTINSRIAWSNCVTPLFMTAALWLLTRALGRDRPWLLVPAGLAVGLGVQTHPSAAALLPGLALGVLLSPVARGWLRTPWPWLGAAAAAAAYANVLWYNLTTGGRSLAAAQERDYAVHPATSLAEFLTNLSALALQLARNAGSSFAPGVPEPSFPLTLTMVGVFALAALGAVAAARRGQWLLPVLLPVSVAMMALIGGEYRPLPHSSSRYLGSLWPVVFALAGLGAVVAGQWLARRSGGRRIVPVALGLACLLLVLLPALTTRAYLDWYGERAWVGPNNDFALATAALVAERYPGQPVYLDTALHDDDSSDAGTMHRSLSMLLRLHGNVPVTLRRTQRPTLRLVWEQLGGTPGPAVLRQDRAQVLEREGALLTPVGDATRVLDPAEGDTRLYEVRLAG
jgi:hypothetical protein